jgi:hypothetical protein
MSLRRNLSNRQKLIAGVVVAAFLLVIFYAITISIQRAGKIRTTVKYAPYTATVKLNDTRISNNATVWLEPGDYHLTVSLDEHLESYQADITISADYNSIIGTLAALDEEGEKYISKHSSDYIDAQGYISTVLNQEGKKLHEQYPILEHLPINNSLYSISYEYDAEDSHPIIHIKSSLKNIDTAVAKLKTFNVDLATQDLVFDTQSPFKNPKANPIQDPVEYIKAAYKLSKDYTIKKAEETDSYCYLVINKSSYAEDLNYAYYRVILKKNTENNNWEIPFDPQPLLTTYNTKDISAEQLNTINSY